jgi:uncharacterized protein (TIGR03435 family)
MPDGSQGHIVDKTGLAGTYDFRLIFDGAAGSRRAMSIGTRVGEAPSQDEVGSDLRDVFNAMERQLELGLLKVKAIPLDTIVIETAILCRSRTERGLPAPAAASPAPTERRQHRYQLVVLQRT